MEAKPYHSRIFQLYLRYLEVEMGWSRDRQDQFLKDLGVTRDRLFDEGAWFDLSFADDFYDRICQETGRQTIAYEAGLFLHEANYSPLTTLLSSFLSVEATYKIAGKLAMHFSKSSTLKVSETGDHAVVIESEVCPGSRERPYMCENRKGILVGTPVLLGFDRANLNETECVYKGGKKCVYHIRWSEKRNYHSALLTLTATLAFMTFGWICFGLMGTTLGLVGGVGIATFQHITRLLNHQRQRLQKQNNDLHKTLLEIEHRSRQMELIAKVSQLAHSSSTLDRLATDLVEGVCKLLSYDRAMFLVVNPELMSLRVKSFFGFDGADQELLSQTEFQISESNNSGFFVAVVNSKQPLFIKDVEANLSKLSPRSKRFAERLGSKSFVAVPIFDQDRNVQGVLAVDNITPGKALSISDQDLLMTLSDNVGISIEQSRLLDQLNTTLSTTRRIATQQANLRSVFEKFVPTQVAQSMSQMADENLSATKMLQTVTKREISVLFCDIFKFTQLATQLPPEDVIDLLNTTFEHLAPVIHRCGGFIDKFTGDGFMAVFEGPEAPVKACAAALNLSQKIQETNNALNSKGYPTIEIGIGINLGQAILGNIGSTDRMNFTVIGEVVNLAARLEAQTRNLGANSICCSSAVRYHTRDHFEWKDLGALQFKGYPDPIHVYQLLDSSEPAQNIALKKITGNQQSS
jgi:class 3 adenylate cyclase